MPIQLGASGIRFNDNTVQTTAAAGGGVTSLNGQTGTITNTGFADIGSYAMLTNATASDISNGATTSGSNLRYGSTPSFDNNGGGNITCQRTDNTTFNCGGTAPSGTWRKMGGGRMFSSHSPNKINTNYLWYTSLFVRVS